MLAAHTCLRDVRGCAGAISCARVRVARRCCTLSFVRVAEGVLRPLLCVRARACVRVRGRVSACAHVRTSLCDCGIAEHHWPPPLRALVRPRATRRRLGPYEALELRCLSTAVYWRLFLTRRRLLPYEALS